MSTAVAHAHPSFELAEAGARAGEVVHFAISDAKGRVTYELEIGDRDVAEGSAPGGSPFAGTFVMPDLGDSPRKVTVEAELRDSDKRKTVKRKLDYLGPAAAISQPPPAAAAPDPAPVVVVPQTISPPAPIHTPGATVTAPPALNASPRSRSQRRPRKSRKRRSAQPRRSAPHGSGGARAKSRAGAEHPRRGRGHADKKKRAKRPLPRTAPLFDGVPEPGARRRAPGEGKGGSAGLNEAAPRAAVVTGTAAGAGGGISTAVVVPVLLALAGMALAGTAISRKRSRRR